MTDASIIIPMTACSPFMEYINNVALRTLRESTDADVLVLGNNTESWAKVEDLERLCRSLDMRFRFIEGRFSQSKCWNFGIDHSQGKYIVFCGADCIFYPDWLDHLIELWEEQPHFYALWPWSFNVTDSGLAYRSTRQAERRIIETHHPAIALVMKRESGYRWDEQFSLWEMDADFVYHCQKNGHKTGLCLWSRVDHFNSAVSSNIPFNNHFGEEQNQEQGNATEYLKRKWNLK